MLSLCYQEPYVVTIFNPETGLRKAFRLNGYQNMDTMFRNYTARFCEYWPAGFYQESVFDEGAYVVEINPTLPCAWYLRCQADQSNLIVTVRLSTTLVPVTIVPIKLMDHYSSEEI